MKWPWTQTTHSDEELKAAHLRVSQARAHLRVLLNELEQTLTRIETRRQRGALGE